MSGKPPKHPPPNVRFPAERLGKDQLVSAYEEAKAARDSAKTQAKTTETVNRESIAPAAYYDRSLDPVAQGLRAASSVLRKEQAAADETIAALEQEYDRLPTLPTALTRRGIAGLFPKAKVNPMTGKGTRRNTKTGGDIVTHMLTIRNQVKLYHWQTGSFARHKATDDLTATLDTLIDSFVESYMGRYGRPKVSGSIPLHNFSESAAKSFVAQQTTYLSSVLPKKIGKNDTDLLNIRDEILGELNKVLYLFTLA